MDPESFQALFAAAAPQHHVVARAQLQALGFSTDAIRHLVASGRVHRVRRGIYAVGRPQLSRYREWMADVLSCGDDAALSHHSAAALWEIRPDLPRRKTSVSMPASVLRRRPEVVLHRRPALRPSHITRHQGFPVTTPVLTLVDIARELPPRDLEGFGGQRREIPQSRHQLGRVLVLADEERALLRDGALNVAEQVDGAGPHTLAQLC